MIGAKRIACLLLFAAGGCTILPIADATDEALIVESLETLSPSPYEIVYRFCLRQECEAEVRVFVEDGTPSGFQLVGPGHSFSPVAFRRAVGDQCEIVAFTAYRYGEGAIVAGNRRTRERVFIVEFAVKETPECGYQTLIVDLEPGHEPEFYPH